MAYCSKLSHLSLTSPVSNAAVWAKSNTLRYDAVLELDNTTGIEDGLQLAIDNGQLINGTRFVPIKLISPSNGSIEVRLTYDWVRLDTPLRFQTCMTDLMMAVVL